MFGKKYPHRVLILMSSSSLALTQSAMYQSSYILAHQSIRFHGRNETLHATRVEKARGELNPFEGDMREESRVCIPHMSVDPRRRGIQDARIEFFG